MLQLRPRPIAQCLLFCVLAGSGCSDDGSAQSQDDGTGGSDTDSTAMDTSTGGGPQGSTADANAEVSLEVLGLVGRDDEQLDATVRLGNDLAVAIPLSPVSFRLVGDDGLERIASSAATEDACPLDELLSPGASVECDLLVESPAGTVPTHLIYSVGVEGEIVEVRATVPQIEDCDRCEGACTDLSGDPDNCGACGRTTLSQTTCVDGELVCAEGIDYQTSSDHCGSCLNTCWELPLADGAADVFCELGECSFVYSDESEETSCDDVCAQAGGVCESATCFGDPNAQTTCDSDGACVGYFTQCTCSAPR